MTKLIHKTGDLFTSTARALAHGVNVEAKMHSGIAVAFKTFYPEMHDEYVDACDRGRLQPGQVFAYRAADRLIYNLASQDRPGANARLEWLDESIRSALSGADFLRIDRIAIPRIGCGVGGLDWADVEPLLAAAAAAYTTDLEVWTL